MSQFTDWSEHLLAAQKALKTAEAHAALKQWDRAEMAAWDAKQCAHDLAEALYVFVVDTPPQSGADKL